MQYESPDPFHDRQLRKRRAADFADRLLVVALIFAVLAFVAAVSGPAWRTLLSVPVWHLADHEMPVNP